VIKKVLIGSFLFILMLSLTGCISYSEESWLNKNGSGKITMEIGINEGLIAMATEDNGEEPFSIGKIEKQFKGKKGLKLINAKAFNKEGNKIIQLEIEFKSLKALEDFMNSENPSGTAGFVGQTNMTKNKKGQITYSRILSFNSGNTSNNNDENGHSAMGEQMMDGLLANYVWQYTIHFPYKVISANTADDYINHKTNTVRWDFSLASLAKKPQTMKAFLRPYNFFESVLHKIKLYN
jgi:hypothetical protein